jgi:hypothetical protein
MPTNTSNQQIPYPLKSDSPGYLAEYIRDAVLALEKRSVMIFTSASDRDSRMVGSFAPVAGNICILLDSLKVLKFNGSSWINVIPNITVSTASPTGGENGDLWLKI